MISQSQYWLIGLNGTQEVFFATVQPGVNYTQPVLNGSIWNLNLSTGFVLKTFTVGQGKFTNLVTTIRFTEI